MLFIFTYVFGVLHRSEFPETLFQEAIKGKIHCSGIIIKTNE